MHKTLSSKIYLKITELTGEIESSIIIKTSVTPLSVMVRKQDRRSIKK